VDDPVLEPHRRWDLCKAVRFGLAQIIAELGADDLGECFDGQEKVLLARTILESALTGRKKFLRDGFQVPSAVTPPPGTR
jgi:hypothetical protein